MVLNGQKSLLDKAWELRQGFPAVLTVSIPGAKHYENRYARNRRQSFVNLSVTGRTCACRCDHCNGKLLETMKSVPTPRAMRQAVDELAAAGCRGILVSGGADARGEVPLLPFVEAMAYARGRGLKVLVHGGLVRPETAAALQEAGVNQVLMDVIGDPLTIRQVYHLDCQPDDFRQALYNCRAAGLEIAPHVVAGLHYGEIRGEMRALEMIRSAEPAIVVMVILTPAAGTTMENVMPPPTHEIAELAAAARMLFPSTPLTLGCARPPGAYKRRVEQAAVDCGFNGIAYPDESTIAHALARGLEVVYSEECCSLTSGQGIGAANSRSVAAFIDG